MMKVIKVKTIKDYPNYYIFSNGRVVNKTTGNDSKIGYQSDRPYARVKIKNKDGWKTIKLHRLLAQSFIANPDGHTVVRHLNDVQTDFRLENLSWGTLSDNMDDRRKNGYINTSHRKLTQDQAEEIRSLHATGNYTYPMLAAEYGIHKCNIGRIIRGERYVKQA